MSGQAPAIRIDGLGKRYRLGVAQRRGRTLRESLADAAKAPFQRVRAVLEGHSTLVSNEYVWAVDRLSLEIGRGEVVGLVGRNGAGKTTLLKLLSRITEPTCGRAEVWGRVASLLEVGTGFHPELTGLENIYLNGAILGMRRAEVVRQFDEIVAFAGIERFVDTQVKHYSSGMYLRLAFAVAAHLETDILLVDEVLAVGDASFQHKCLGKMSTVARSGRTVIFVSHNLEAIHRLCERCIWIDDGKVAADGPTHGVITEYLRAAMDRSQSSYRAPGDSSGDRAVLLEAEILSAVGRPTGDLGFGEPFSVRTRWRYRERIAGAYPFLRLFDAQGRFLFAVNPVGTSLDFEGAGDHEVLCRFDANVLVPGDYTLTVGCFLPPRTYLHLAEEALTFTVLEVPFDGSVLNVPEKSLFAPRASWLLGASGAAVEPGETAGRAEVVGERAR